MVVQVSQTNTQKPPLRKMTLQNPVKRSYKCSYCTGPF